MTMARRFLQIIGNRAFSSNSNRPPAKTTFASLFRDSPYCQLGSPEGKIVHGKIVAVAEEDLYIDFGFKFNAVCRRPKQNAHNYARGAIVRVRINDLELSDRFLGSHQDMTLLEADVTLLGLVSSPVVTTNAAAGNTKPDATPQTSTVKRVVVSRKSS